ncbi:MAG: Allantoinase, partial [uncultured Solirubrobacteraceae bacterium]
ERLRRHRPRRHRRATGGDRRSRHRDQRRAHRRAGARAPRLRRRGGRRARPARAARRRRRARPLQRAGADPLGGLGHGHSLPGRRRLHLRGGDAAQRPSADRRRSELRPEARGRRAQRPRRLRPLGRPHPRSPRPARRARRARRGRLQGVHVQQRHPRLPGVEGRRPLGGDEAGQEAGTADRGARRERVDHQRAGRARPLRGPQRRARLSRVAARRGRAAGHRPGRGAGRGRRLLAAHRPRLDGARRRRRRVGPRPRRGRDLRDVPALPGADRGRHGGARGGGQVRPAASQRRRPGVAVAGARGRDAADGGLRPLPRAGRPQDGRRLLRRLGRHLGLPEPASADAQRGSPRPGHPARADRRHHRRVPGAALRPHRQGPARGGRRRRHRPGAARRGLEARGGAPLLSPPPQPVPGPVDERTRPQHPPSRHHGVPRRGDSGGAGWAVGHPAEESL